MGSPLRFGLLLCLCGMAVSAQEVTPGPDTVTVGGTTISARHVLSRLASDFGSTLLEERILELLVLDRAEAEGVTVDEETVLNHLNASLGDIPLAQHLARTGLTFDRALEKTRIEVLANAIIDGEITVTGEEVSKLYDDSRELLRKPEKRLVVHQLYLDENQAHRGADELRRGGQVGEEFLRLYDRPRGEVTEGYALALMRAVFQELRAVGDVSDPIPLEDGWHVIRLENVVPAQDVSYEESYDMLHHELLVQRREERKPEWLKELREAGRVEIRVEFPPPD